MSMFKVGDEVVHSLYGRGTIIRDDKSSIPFYIAIKSPSGETISYTWATSLSLSLCVETVYVVYKCSSSSWPQDGRVCGVRKGVEAANRLRDEVKKKHPNAHIAVLKFKAE